MTLRKISKSQPENFEFTKESLEEANNIIQKYPAGREQSAVMSLLNTNNSGCFLDIFFKLIYLPLQKQYQVILKQQEHQPTYGL